MPGTPCKVCGAPIPPPVGKGRPRTRCADCAPSHRKVPKVPPLAVVIANRAAASPGVDEDGKGPLQRAVEAELGALGRLESIDGQAALDAARTIDSGRLSAASRAALLLELRRAAEGARKGGSAAASKLDDIRARREQRRSS